MLRHYQYLATQDLHRRCVNYFNPEKDGSIHLPTLKGKLSSDLPVDLSETEESYGNGEFGPVSLMGLVTLGNGLTFWGMASSAPGEHPVFWLVYWDSRKLRAYVPIKGNPWNTDTGKPYGRDLLADLLNVQYRWPEHYSMRSAGDIEGLRFDAGEILNDILSAFEVRARV